MVGKMVASSLRGKFLLLSGKVERRVLLYDVGTDVGLITCVCGRIGQAPNHSTPVSGGTGVQSGPP